MQGIAFVDARQFDRNWITKALRAPQSSAPDQAAAGAVGQPGRQVVDGRWAAPSSALAHTGVDASLVPRHALRPVLRLLLLQGREQLLVRQALQWPRVAWISHRELA